MVVTEAPRAPQKEIKGKLRRKFNKTPQKSNFE